LLFIAEWFDAIRSHPHVQNVIEKVTTMDPSDYLLLPSEWRAKLLSYADTMDNSIQRMMEHRHFRTARNWLHTTIQNVSCTLHFKLFLHFHKSLTSINNFWYMIAPKSPIFIRDTCLSDVSDKQSTSQGYFYTNIYNRQW